ncbi:MAG: right-handed parallel beta-helix repeat-containing protein [Phycisphaerales bacterium]|nr:right-handed parallel beta-helix repeat-containing protein [Phycisphaerales bacterium]
MDNRTTSPLASLVRPHAPLLLLISAFFAAQLAEAPSANASGPLDPPAGPVAPTPGPEPRTPISATTTPGDANNIYRITQPGSYYLTASIAAVGSKNAIIILADNVTLDLNGFTIDGTGASSFPSGITTGNTTHRRVVIRNGNVNNFPGYGITGQLTDSHFEDLALNSNKSGSLEVFQSSSCIARHIRVKATTGEAGIELSENARVEDCIVDGAGIGIGVGANSVVTGCVVTNQPATGISIGGGIVENCSVYVTTSTGSFNNAGISAGHGAVVRACTIRNVVSAGVFISGNGSIEDCQISQCARGIASSQFSGGSARIQGNDLNDCSTIAIDLPAGKHMVLGNRLRGNAANINANASVVLGDVVTCGPGALPAAAANPTANLVW